MVDPTEALLTTEMTTHSFGLQKLGMGMVTYRWALHYARDASCYKGANNGFRVSRTYQVVSSDGVGAPQQKYVLLIVLMLLYTMEI